MDTCTRCGAFIPLETVPWRTGRFCPKCAGRPEVLAVGRFVLRYARRRNSWHWLCLAMGLGVALLATTVLSTGAYGAAAALLAPLFVSLTLFLRLRLSRVLLFLLPVVLAIPLINAHRWLPAVVVLGIMEAFAFALAMDPAVRLSLGLEVPHETLEGWVDREHSNPEARSALLLAAASFVVPPLAPLAFARAARAVDNLGHIVEPPVGRMGTALAAAFLCLVAPMFSMPLLTTVLGVERREGHAPRAVPPDAASQMSVGGDCFRRGEDAGRSGKRPTFSLWRRESMHAIAVPNRRNHPTFATQAVRGAPPEGLTTSTARSCRAGRTTAAVYSSFWALVRRSELRGRWAL